MSEPALILFAHGARDPEWARPVEAVAAQLRILFPARSVRVAFLEFLAPTLEQAVTTHVNDMGAASRVDILPFFIAQGGHLRKELPEMLAELKGRYPEVHFNLLSPLGELPEVQSAMARAIATLVTPISR
jgi:sirohydrochlorin cobaltochelatase